MKNLLRTSIISLFAGLCSLIGFSAESREHIDLEFKTQTLSLVVAERSVAERPSISRPSAGDLPTTLKLAAPPRMATLVDAGNPQHSALETRAAVAATWAARQQIDLFARRELYRAGFYDALQSAMADPNLGRWDFDEGLKAGRQDPGITIGSEIGASDAARVAGSVARAHVTAQWQRSREPRPNPSPAPAKLTASMPDVREPRLFDVFDDLPLSPALEATSAQALRSPWALFRHESYGDFYNNRWSDSARAFDYWLNHHRDRAAWSELDSDERSLFQQLFQSAYSHQLVDLVAYSGEVAYSEGYDDGWDYGTSIAYEWSYRRGYHQGFEAAVQEHAQIAFQEAYPRLYRKKYDELFQQRSQSARLEISALRSEDGPGTGSLEP